MTTSSPSPHVPITVVPEPYFDARSPMPSAVDPVKPGTAQPSVVVEKKVDAISAAQRPAIPAAAVAQDLSIDYLKDRIEGVRSPMASPAFEVEIPPAQPVQNQALSPVPAARQAAVTTSSPETRAVASTRAQRNEVSRPTTASPEEYEAPRRAPAEAAPKAAAPSPEAAQEAARLRAQAELIAIGREHEPAVTQVSRMLAADVVANKIMRTPGRVSYDITLNTAEPAQIEDRMQRALMKTYGAEANPVALARAISLKDADGKAINLLEAVKADRASQRLADPRSSPSPHAPISAAEVYATVASRVAQGSAYHIKDNKSVVARFTGSLVADDAQISSQGKVAYTGADIRAGIEERLYLGAGARQSALQHGDPGGAAVQQQMGQAMAKEWLEPPTHLRAKPSPEAQYFIDMAHGRIDLVKEPKSGFQRAVHDLFHGEPAGEAFVSAPKKPEESPKPATSRASLGTVSSTDPELVSEVPASSSASKAPSAITAEILSAIPTVLPTQEPVPSPRSTAASAQTSLASDPDDLSRTDSQQATRRPLSTSLPTVEASSGATTAATAVQTTRDVGETLPADLSGNATQTPRVPTIEVLDAIMHASKVSGVPMLPEEGT